MGGAAQVSVEHNDSRLRMTDLGSTLVVSTESGVECLNLHPAISTLFEG